ncbi:hypothetical protein [Streptomyces sp. NPDC057496]|uniref:hypothetical protein n=1 Tax=Streptomyces sp. NPDC057496 TaxID=3346149 RepID=UPI0036BCC2C1
MTFVPYARTADSVRCWLCGTTNGPLRSDIHLKGHLCPSCWDAQPRSYNTWVRAASALAQRLDLGRHWTGTGFRHQWLQDAARQHGVTAWHDVPRDTEPPAEPFGWITPDALETAAADLARQEEEFQQACIPPDARATGKAGPQ